MKFKTIVLIIFIIFGAVGVAFLALSGRGGGGGQGGVDILVWGTVSRDLVSQIVREVNADNEGGLNIVYVQKNSDTYESDLLEAIASGNSPDVIIFPDEFIIKHSNKIIPIPFESFPEADFKRDFIEAGEVFISGAQILALPFSVDPLVLYWNRDIFSNEGIASPPETWTEILSLAPTLTVVDSNLNITRSAVALGEYDNIDHAKEIVYALLLQVGNSIVGFENNKYVSTLISETESASRSALNFYTGFADPRKATYSWNRSLPNSKDAFLAGDVALYIGFTSEEVELERRNPNLNFGVVSLPQLEDTSKKTTFADIKGFAVLRSTANPTDAFNTLYALTGPEVVSLWTSLSGEPPVRRGLIQRGGQASQEIFHNSALWAQGVEEPDDTATSEIIREMINSITSGRQTIEGSMRRAHQTLNRTLEDLQFSN